MFILIMLAIRLERLVKRLAAISKKQNLVTMCRERLTVE